MNLTKEQMFDFILNNHVDISVDGTWYTKYDDAGNEIGKFQNKYRVSINGCGMLGFDLEQAIHYYWEHLATNTEEGFYACH